LTVLETEQQKLVSIIWRDTLIMCNTKCNHCNDGIITIGRISIRIM